MGLSVYLVLIKERNKTSIAAIPPPREKRKIRLRPVGGNTAKTFSKNLKLQNKTKNKEIRISNVLGRKASFCNNIWEKLLNKRT